MGHDPQQVPTVLAQSENDPTFFVAACPACNRPQKIPIHYHEKPVKCVHCSAAFAVISTERAAELRAQKERQQAAEKKQQRTRHRERMVSYLEQTRDLDYVQLENTWRNTLEQEHAVMLEEGIEGWGDAEQRLHVLLTTKPGREYWQDRSWRAEVISLLRGNLHMQRELLESFSTIQSKLGAVKTAATVGGLVAAHELGQRIGDMVDGD